MNQTYKATLSQYALPQFLPIYSWGCLNFTLRYSCFPLRSKWGGKGGVIWGDLEGCSLKTMMFEKYPSISPYTYCANNPMKYVDPTGEDWYEAEDGKVTWTDCTNKKDFTASGIKGTYLGKTHKADGKYHSLFGQTMNANSKQLKIKKKLMYWSMK